MEKEQIAALVNRARGGDREAMNALLEAAHPLVQKECRMVLRNSEDAQDITQEALLQIYQKLDSLQDPERFVPWACRIASNLCLNALRRRPRELQFLEDEDGGSVLDDLEDLDEQRVPDAAVDNAETRRMLAELVDGLPQAQRTAVYLYYYGDMSVKEIAKRQNVSENTVKSRLNYARKAIQEGVLDYEKQGVKLYGLSPLPFLVFFLRKAAQAEGDPVAAHDDAVRVLELAGAGVASAVGAGEAATGAGEATATSSTVGAGETATASSTSGTVGAPSAAADAAGGAAGKSAALSATGIKVAAGVLAGAVLVGGVGLALSTGREAPQPVEEPAISDPAESVPLEPEESTQTDGPVEIADYTTRRVEVDTGMDNVVIYLEYPYFDEASEGYRKLNEDFAEIAQLYEDRSEPNIAYILSRLDQMTGDYEARYIEVYTVDSQDGETVSINSVCEWSEKKGGRTEIYSKNSTAVPMTFDARTGELTSYDAEAHREGYRETMLESFGTDSWEEVTRRPDYGRNNNVFYREQFGTFGISKGPD